MNESFAPERADAYRTLIVEHVAATPRPPRRALWTVGLVLIGAVGGAGISTAAYATTGGFDRAAVIAQPSGQPAPGGAPVVAPDGVEPGSPIISLLGEPTMHRITQTMTVDLADRPAAATHARVTVAPITSGTLSWGTDPGGNNSRGIWTQSDIEHGDTRSWNDLPLDASTNTVYVDPGLGFTGVIIVQYETQIPTHLATNANGQTYGVEGGPDGTPDLIRVVGTAADGSSIEGYAASVDLNAFSPDHPDLPTTPSEAGRLQNERDQKYPNGWDIPVYESDGTTQIGTFHIGN